MFPCQQCQRRAKRVEHELVPNQSRARANSESEWQLVPNQTRARVRQRFMQMIKAMISRKQWAMKGMLRKYAKNMPKQIDGPASGFGKHIG